MYIYKINTMNNPVNLGVIHNTDTDMIRVIISVIYLHTLCALIPETKNNTNCDKWASPGIYEYDMYNISVVCFENILGDSQNEQ